VLWRIDEDLAALCKAARGPCDGRLDVSERTVERWLRWWLEVFPATAAFADWALRSCRGIARAGKVPG
jgi:hypothetical protein